MLKNKVLFYGAASFLFFAVFFLSIAQYPILNPDGILYLTAAKAYQSSGFQSAIMIYRWPFYSCLLGFSSSVLHLPILYTAYLLNFIFFMGIIFSFAAIVRQLGGSFKLQCLAFFIVLFFRPLNKYMHQAVRDNGYWCFMLLSVFLLIHFSKKLTWQSAFLWAAAASLAILFRVEGEIFLICLPFIVFLFSQHSWGERFFAWFKLMFFVVFFQALVLMFLWKYDVHATGQWGRLSELLLYVKSGGMLFLENFHTARLQMSQYVMPEQYRHMARAVLFWGILTTYAWLTLCALTVAHVINVGYAFAKRIKFQKIACLIIFMYILLNLIITASYTLINFNFDSRYYQLVCLLLLLYAPFGFALLYQRAIKVKESSVFEKSLFFVMIIFWMMMVVGSLIHIGPSKRYIYNASRWVDKNVASTAKIYTNSGQLAVLIKQPVSGWECPHGIPAAHCFDWSTFGNKYWENNHYFIVESKRNNPQLETLIQSVGSKPVAIFKGHRPKREMLIFKLN